MSRANAHTARLLRERNTDDTNYLKVRNRITKANNMGYSNAIVNNCEGSDLNQLLDDRGNEYSEKIANLTKRIKQSKGKLKTESYNSEWLKECKRLRGLSDKLNAGILHTVENIVILGLGYNDAYDDIIANASVNTIAQDMDNLNQSQKLNTDDICTQLKDIKDMVKMVKHKPKAEDPAGDTTDTKDITPPGNVANLPMAAILADILLATRAAHSERWAYLQKFEKEMTADLSITTRSIFRMLRESRLQEQNFALQEEFDAILKDSSAEEDSSNEEIEMELEVVVNEWLTKIADLDEAHRNDSNTVSKAKEKEEIYTKFGIIRGLDPEQGQGGESDPATNSGRGGWESSTHDTFLKIFRQAERGSAGMPRKQMLDRMLHELQPYHITLDQIRDHEGWYKSMRTINNKYRESELQFASKRMQLIEDATQAVRSCRDSFREKRSRDRLIGDHERRRAELHVVLNQQRKRKEIRDQEQQERLRLEQEALAERIRKEEEVLQGEREERKQQVERFRHEQAVLELETKRQEAEARQQAQEDLKRLVEMNKSKVMGRQQQIVEKNEQRKRQEVELQKEEEARMELLMKLAEQVPYFESIQNASSKLDHITAAVKHGEYQGLADRSRGFHPLNGFDDKKTISDSRFRLAEALRSAGVHQSSFAAQAVQAVHQRPHLAIHGLL